MIVVLTGVAGAGKSTVGREVAARLGAEFLDADDLHPRRNVAKMAAGEPLDDADRAPWLERVRREILERERSGRPSVVACSALKDSYRRTLLDGTRGVRLVHLRAEAGELKRRLTERRGHFFDPALLATQLEALEEPQGDAVTIETGDGLEATVAAVLAAVRGEARGRDVGETGRSGADGD